MVHDNLLPSDPHPQCSMERGGEGCYLAHKRFVADVSKDQIHCDAKGRWLLVINAILSLFDWKNDVTIVFVWRLDRHKRRIYSIYKVC